MIGGHAIPGDHAKRNGLASQIVTIADTTLNLLVLDLDEHDSEDQTLLTDAERDRVARFHRPVDRIRCATRRLLLRRILGEQLGIPGGQLEFEPGPWGKPRAKHPAAATLDFNTSHSGRWFALAWSFEASVGIDIEVRRQLPDGSSLARRWLTPLELEQAINAGHDLDGDGFLRLWCRKEAVMKAAGLGLSLDPTSFSIPTDLVVAEASTVRVESLDPSEFHLLDVTRSGWPEDVLITACVHEPPRRRP